MGTLFPLFDSEEDRPPLAARLAPRLRTLADQGVFFGTSSWKYPGWLGSIYSADRYETRGAFSKKKFDEQCLTEYAETFPTVCGDLTFYQFPSPPYWAKLFGATPGAFTMAFKVPEEITVARWPKHARYGTKAGTDNAHFLSADLLKTLFLRRLAPYADRVATLIFEFGTFPKSQFPTPDDFLNRLDRFLEELPGGFRYSVEVRNPEYLGPNYFGLLNAYGVAHVLNAWTRMPTLEAQVEMPGVFDADFTVVRALLAKGRGYEDAVRSFEPYDAIKEPNPGVRSALARVAEQARTRKKPAFLFVNNRLEGHSPGTIDAVVDQLGV
jgi:uncharacterized protein YecE (DUF72 family)